MNLSNATGRLDPSPQHDSLITLIPYDEKTAKHGHWILEADEIQQDLENIGLRKPRPRPRRPPGKTMSNLLSVLRADNHENVQTSMLLPSMPMPMQDHHHRQSHTSLQVHPVHPFSQEHRHQAQAFEARSGMNRADTITLRDEALPLATAQYDARGRLSGVEGREVPVLSIPHYNNISNDQSRLYSLPHSPEDPYREYGGSGNSVARQQYVEQQQQPPFINHQSHNWQPTKSLHLYPVNNPTDTSRMFGSSSALNNQASMDKMLTNLPQTGHASTSEWTRDVEAARTASLIESSRSLHSPQAWIPTDYPHQRQHPHMIHQPRDQSESARTPARYPPHSLLDYSRIPSNSLTSTQSNPRPYIQPTLHYDRAAAREEASQRKASIYRHLHGNQQEARRAKWEAYSQYPYIGNDRPSFSANQAGSPPATAKYGATVSKYQGYDHPDPHRGITRDPAYRESPSMEPGTNPLPLSAETLSTWNAVKPR